MAATRFALVIKPNRRHGAGCLFDLRREGLPAGRAERDLPALRFGDLHSFDRARGGCNPSVYVKGRWK
jgi:hypothetical protein